MYSKNFASWFVEGLEYAQATEGHQETPLYDHNNRLGSMFYVTMLGSQTISMYTTNTNNTRVTLQHHNRIPQTDCTQLQLTKHKYSSLEFLAGRI